MTLSSSRAQVAILLILSMAAVQQCQDSISFPEVEEDETVRNTDNRKPMFNPDRCQVNELLYPGDQKNDWICDCRPGFLYHPTSDMCYEAYRRGPCAEREYLVLPADSVRPRCERNACERDGLVPYGAGDACARLHDTAPCGGDAVHRAELAVNATTLALDCISLESEGVVNRFGEEPPVPKPCAPGSKKAVNGFCSS